MARSGEIGRDRARSGEVSLSSTLIDAQRLLRGSLVLGVVIVKPSVKLLRSYCAVAEARREAGPAEGGLGVGWCRDAKCMVVVACACCADPHSGSTVQAGVWGMGGLEVIVGFGSAWLCVRIITRHLQRPLQAGPGLPRLRRCRDHV